MRIKISGWTRQLPSGKAVMMQFWLGNALHFIQLVAIFETLKVWNPFLWELRVRRFENLCCGLPKQLPLKY